LQTAMPDLAHQRDRLQPAEALFNSLPFSLADLVALMPSCAAVDGAAAASFHVLGYLRRHLQISALRVEIPGIVSLVAPHRNAPRARKLLQHQHCTLPLPRTIGLQQFGIHDQSVAVLGQQIAGVTELGLFAVTLPRQARICISSGLVRVIAALLAMEVQRRISWIIRRRTVLLISALEALQTGP